VRLRRLAGTASILAGAALLTAAGADVARGALARDAARAAWDRELARLAVESVERAVSPDDEAAPVRGAPLARLRIPRLGIDEIVVQGVGDAELRAGPGHLPGSAFPGDSGNSVISAHRDRHFRALGELAIGDTVTTETRAGTVEWVVTRRTVVRRGAPALYSTADPVLTLTTCWPIRAFGPAPERLLYEARRI
jgi:sortase A